MSDTGDKYRESDDAARLRERVAALESDLRTANTTIQRLLTPPREDALSEIEERLRQRTDDLARLNAQLQQEIVDHNRTAQRLRASQRSLLDSQRLAHIGSWEYDPATEQATWSEELYRLYGLLPGTFAPSLASVLACIPPEEHAAIVETLKKVKHSPQPLSYTHRIIRADGSVRFVEGLCDRVRDAQGPCDRIVGIARDVTMEHDRAAVLDQTLRDLRQFKDMVNRSPAVVALWGADPDSTVEFISESIRRFGYSSADITSGRIRWLDFLHPDDRARVTAEYAAHVEAGHAVFPLAYRLRTASGETRWIHEEVTCIAFNGTKRFQAVLLDVTAEREAEHRFHDVEALNQIIIAAAPVGIAAYDRSGQCVFTNPAMGHMLNAPVDQLMRQNFHDLASWRQSGLRSLALATLNTGISRSDVIHVTSSFGREMWADCSLARFQRAGEPHLLVVCHDITERRRAEEQFRQTDLRYQQQLRHLAAEIAMAGEQERRRIAVELHDGLGQALVLCKMKLESVKSESESAALRRQIQSSVRLVEEAIRDTRSLTFQLSPPVLHEIGLNAAIEWLADHLGEQHGMTIRVTRESEHEPAAMAVRVILFQSVRELVFNAIKHATATVIAVDIRARRGHLEIRVQDDGAGFDAGAQRGGTRTGMGLFNIQERVQLIGGAMTIESRPGKGTGVTLVAPLEAPPAEDRKGTPHEHSHCTV